MLEGVFRMGLTGSFRVNGQQKVVGKGENFHLTQKMSLKES